MPGKDIQKSLASGLLLACNWTADAAAEGGHTPRNRYSERQQREYATVRALPVNQ